MDLQEELELQRRGYQECVRPLIEKGEYRSAHMEMCNLNFVMAERRKEIGLNIHCGLSYLAYASLLRDALFEGDEEAIKTRREAFEAFSAQTKLPLQ